MNTFFIVSGAITALILGGMFVEYWLEKRDRKNFPSPGRCINLSGQSLHLHCTGEKQAGKPLILLEAGTACWSYYWRLVQPEIAKFARVCSYDRAGLGWSSGGQKPRSAQKITAELHSALQEGDEPSPYIIVGHSFGGIFARDFARAYPNEIAGMVLIDSAHEDQLRVMPEAYEAARRIQFSFSIFAAFHRIGILRLLGKTVLARFATLRTPDERKLFLATLLASRYFETRRDEMYTLLNPPKPEDRLLSLGDRPLVVIKASGEPRELPRGMTPHRWQQQRCAWDEIQHGLLTLSPTSRLFTADKSIHTVQIEQLDMVVNAIRQVHEFHDRGWGNDRKIEVF